MEQEYKDVIAALAQRLAVHEAVLRALVAAHPNPAEARRLAASVLTGAQGMFAASALQSPSKSPLPPAVVQPILDALFQPPIYLPPDEG